MTTNIDNITCGDALKAASALVPTGTIMLPLEWYAGCGLVKADDHNVLLGAFPYSKLREWCARGASPAEFEELLKQPWGKF